MGRTEEDSGSDSEGSNHSAAGSASHASSPTGSPRSLKSGSSSPQSARSSRSRSKSKTPSVRSKSGSRSRSRSTTPQSRSSSVSSKKSHSSRSGRSKSGSRSRSRSPSQSPSASSRRSRSKSGSRSRSGSPASRRSSASRSRSVSPAASSRVSTTVSKRSPESTTQRKPVSPRSSEDESTVSEVKKKKDETGADASQLFGDADDISSGSSDDEPVKKSSKRQLRSDDEDEEVEKRSGSGEERMDVDEPSGRKSDQDEDEEMKSDTGSPRRGSDAEAEEPPAPPPETRIDVEIPKITTDLGKGIHFVKLPNFLSVEPRPFDPSTYEDEIDDEETLDEEGRARLKLKVENTIRWREKFNDAGVFVKQSNARMVKWSDGSLSLHLGDEIFNVYQQPLQGDHNHLFIRQGTGLQGQAVFRTKLTFRPHSTESFTHRKMTLSLADRSQKTTGIKVLSIVGANPEANRDERIKKEEDKLRASLRKESRVRRTKDRSVGRSGLSAAYLDNDYDDDDDDNAISLSAIKNKYKKDNVSNKFRGNIYSSDDEDGDDGSDIEQTRRKPDKKTKRLQDSDESDEGAGGEDADKAEENSKASESE